MTVVLVMIDGVRPDALDMVACPHLGALEQRGAATRAARSVMPSITLPCHMSIFHSLSPVQHGIHANECAPMPRPVPGLVEVARAQGRQCAFFYNWEPLRCLSQPGSLALSYFRDGAESNPHSDEHIAEVAARTLQANDFDFAFVYLGTIDTAGHAYGWLSEGYLAQLAYVDGVLGGLLAALPHGSSVLVQSDHGGHDYGHGTDRPEDMTIPWMLAGPAIRSGFAIASTVSLLDTAPTLARLLALEPPAEWMGRCIDEAFVPAA